MPLIYTFTFTQHEDSKRLGNSLKLNVITYVLTGFLQTNGRSEPIHSAQQPDLPQTLCVFLRLPACNHIHK